MDRQMGFIERSAPDKAKKAFLKSLQLPEDSDSGTDGQGGGDADGPSDGQGGGDDGGPSDGQGGGGGQPAAPIITLPVFVLGLRHLAHGIVAGGAKQAGWQFLTIDSRDVITSGETPDSESGAT